MKIEEIQDILSSLSLCGLFLECTADTESDENGNVLNVIFHCIGTQGYSKTEKIGLLTLKNIEHQIKKNFKTYDRSSADLK